MKDVYGYIRVSTAKQGEGVSLIEQKDAISRYATQQNLKIVQWFEEKETAAKQGRPLFNAMIKQLKARNANGVIIHKIDRSARNLRDWADLGDLIDCGIEVHFAHESLDLQARGGRLSADIQAVIASDYIRNLREEAVKGLYGRLKQGIYPFGAPIGYLNRGGGKLKEIDPLKGPLVRRVFELYATRQYSLKMLLPIIYELGLRNTSGKRINLSSLSLLLNNPFYTGLINVKGKIYRGEHKPLISSRLFKQVQSVLRGNCNVKVKKYDFLFRRSIKCEYCKYSLIGEMQKGHIYYRCHTKNCPTKGLRETTIEHFLKNALRTMELYPSEVAILENLLSDTEITWATKQQEMIKAIQLQRNQLSSRLERLTDAFIDGIIDSETYSERKENFLLEEKELERKEKEITTEKEGIFTKARKFLEQVKSLRNIYEIGFLNEKRELIKIITSNLSAQGKNLMITMKSPYYEMSQRGFLTSSRHERNASRKQNRILVYSDKNTSPIIGKPLSREQLKLLLDEILKHVRSVDFKDDFEV